HPPSLPPPAPRRSTPHGATPFDPPPGRAFPPQPERLPQPRAHGRPRHRHAQRLRHLPHPEPALFRERLHRRLDLLRLKGLDLLDDRPQLAQHLHPPRLPLPQALLHRLLVKHDLIVPHQRKRHGPCRIRQRLRARLHRPRGKLKPLPEFLHHLRRIHLAPLAPSPRELLIAHRRDRILV